MNGGTERAVRLLRKLGFVLFVSGLVLSALALRTLVLGRAALAEAERAFDRGELRESVRQARTAATLALPGAPHVEAAYARLLVIARGAEATSRLHLAAFAWNAVRGAALETKFPGAEARSELELANQNLARLATRLAAGGVDDPAGERMLLATLEKPASPNTTWLWLFFLGGFATLAGVGCAALFGFRNDGRLEPLKLAFAAALVIIGAACWTFAVYRA